MASADTMGCIAIEIEMTPVRIDKRANSSTDSTMQSESTNQSSRQPQMDVLSFLSESVVDGSEWAQPACGRTTMIIFPAAARWIDVQQESCLFHGDFVVRHIHFVGTRMSFCRNKHFICSGTSQQAHWIVVGGVPVCREVCSCSCLRHLCF